MSKKQPTTTAAEASTQANYPAGELLNAVTHGTGLVLSIVGGIALVTHALASGDPWRIAGCVIFSMTLIAVYAFSTLSHSAFTPDRVRLFERLDQGFIYLLIVGTYTPFALVYLRTDGWWLLFVTMWTLALSGCCGKIFFPHRIRGVAVWTYVLLGWLPTIAARPLLELIPAGAVWGILIGGLCYTFGTVFLFCSNKHLYFHAIWHLFVVAGSTSHFLTILMFVA